MKPVFFVLVLAVSGIANAAESPVNVECTASGKSFRNNQGVQAASAKFTFSVSENSAGTRELKNFEGKLSIGLNGSKPYGAEASNAEFKNETLTADPKYHPTKYKGYDQYADVNASHTWGAEDGMWGVFLLEKIFLGTIEARYIFKAGDDLGGTLRLTCKKLK